MRKSLIADLGKARDHGNSRMIFSLSSLSTRGRLREQRQERGQQRQERAAAGLAVGGTAFLIFPLTIFLFQPRPPWHQPVNLAAFCRGGSRSTAPLSLLGREEGRAEKTRARRERERENGRKREASAISLPIREFPVDVSLRRWKERPMLRACATAAPAVFRSYRHHWWQRHRKAKDTDRAPCCRPTSAEW